MLSEEIRFFWYHQLNMASMHWHYIQEFGYIQPKMIEKQVIDP